MIFSVQFGKPSSKLSSQKYFNFFPAAVASARRGSPRCLNCNSTPSGASQSTESPSASGGGIITRDPVIRWPVRIIVHRPGGMSHSSRPSEVTRDVRITIFSTGMGLSADAAFHGVETGPITSRERMKLLASLRFVFAASSFTRSSTSFSPAVSGSGKATTDVSR